MTNYLVVGIIVVLAFFIWLVKRNTKAVIVLREKQKIVPERLRKICDDAYNLGYSLQIAKKDNDIRIFSVRKFCLDHKFSVKEIRDFIVIEGFFYDGIKDAKAGKPNKLAISTK
ncbi:hypothetical protein A2533_03965 [Candidatus Falkowbacteria bacterium RIFOXYD2_FULL_35_9]|uniref:Uncharacterized protein n=1 Tax=Candidatus Falkowbacteria bacterium RIFOXYC2_FULL_36_12 TaxID=1798002 RepID=A0A1F5SWT0_9BACT|nr:MAG: hypothetical protein A2478_00490 [Candidatus Falkowbacteria bacterium RIFOXYC2_FULL_36_12]OGF33614.1 MAG: hypothetical protein A2223_03630 [Candidatus Falkowbacteria bacterium RIFOXYA2_FULL_35_8]OGF48148.1 MAG: hypothetical protein A2533_03965 [Candidatus Falkowbacteria bacterium RIFOXYD2_FULL_35_9]